MLLFSCNIKNKEKATALPKTDSAIARSAEELIVGSWSYLHTEKDQSKQKISLFWHILFNQDHSFVEESKIADEESTLKREGKYLLSDSILYRSGFGTLDLLYITEDSLVLRKNDLCFTFTRE